MLELLQSLKYNLLHVGYAQLDSKWDYDNVVSPFTRLFLVTKGEAVAYHSGKAFQLRPGYMYIIPNYVYNRYKCEDFHEQYYISFFDEIQSGLSIFNIKNFTIEVEATKLDRALFERLVALYPNRKVTDSEPKSYIRGLAGMLESNKRDAKLETNTFLEAQGILSVLLSRFMKNTNTEYLAIGKKRSLNRTLLHIAENLHEPLTVKELAELSNLSVDHFSRLFKQQMNINPNTYIRSRRIRRAQLLLLTTNDTIGQISLKVGFESYAHFSRTFKLLTGKTPVDFRREKPQV